MNLIYGRLQAVIFDFDGLILDTEVALFETWQETFTEQGWPLDLEAWGDNVGAKDYSVFDPHVYIREQIADPAVRDEIERRHREAYLARLAKMDCLPGVRDAIAYARGAGYKLGVASSSSKAWVTGHLSELGLLDNFTAVSCKDGVGAVKPNPDIYLRALEMLDVDPVRAVAVEDSPPGALAAKRAGMWCVAIPNRTTRHLDYSHADRQLPSLDAEPFGAVLESIEELMQRAL